MIAQAGTAKKESSKELRFAFSNSKFSKRLLSNVSRNGMNSVSAIKAARSVSPI